jgi:hypothetical protein
MIFSVNKMTNIIKIYAYKYNCDVSSLNPNEGVKFNDFSLIVELDLTNWMNKF